MISEKHATLEQLQNAVHSAYVLCAASASNVMLLLMPLGQLISISFEPIGTLPGSSRPRTIISVQTSHFSLQAVPQEKIMTVADCYAFEITDSYPYDSHLRLSCR